MKRCIPMKKKILAVALLALLAGACGPTPTSPDCDDPAGCEILPDPNG